MIRRTSTELCRARDPEYLSVLLQDSTCLRIRLVTPRDRAHLVEGFSRLSKESRYTRFFSYIPALQGPILDNLADLSGYFHVAIGAFAENDELGHGVGVARAIQPSPGAPAELAVTVVDGAQGMGLGELLLHILVVLTAKLGVTTFTATTLRENRAAGKAFRRIGATTSPDPEDMSIMLVTLESADLAKLHGWPPNLEQEIQVFVDHVSSLVLMEQTGAGMTPAEAVPQTGIPASVPTAQPELPPPTEFE